MVSVIGVVTGLASVIILTVRLCLDDSNKRVSGLMISWWLTLLATGLFAGFGSIGTYVPDQIRILSNWVNVRTGEIVGVGDYEVVKEGSGDNPVFMAIIIPFVFAIFSLIVAGSVAASKNLARVVNNTGLKILVFISWFLQLLFCGIFTLGIFPMYMAHTSNKQNISFRMKIAVTVLSIVFALLFIFMMRRYR